MARWTRPRRFDRNLIVVGAGSAGLVAALVAARLGAKVTLAEGGRMGGDCLNTGCVPSKALLHAAGLVAEARAAAALGLLPPPGPVDSAAAFAFVRRAIEQVAPHDSEARYSGLGVDVRRGHAVLTSPWTVAVDGAEISARAIVLATGAAPVVPDIPGLAAIGARTSESVWELERAPARLVVLGGGPVGCELAQGFARLGSAVVLMQRGPRLLPREDEDVATLLRACLERDGVRVLTGAAAVRAEAGALHLEGGERLAFDTLLLATGRRARTAGFGLEALGVVPTEAGTIPTDALLRVPPWRHIYACGDAAGPWQFTHAAGHQGWQAAVNALFGGLPRLRPNRAAMPAVTYTAPEIARIGLTEREAAARGVRCVVTRHALDELDRAIVQDAREGFVKVLTQAGGDRILGAAIVAPRAGEMLGEFALAMGQGIGLKRLGAGVVRAYPGWLEANRDAATAWRTSGAPGWTTGALARLHAWRRG